MEGEFEFVVFLALFFRLQGVLPHGIFLKSIGTLLSAVFGKVVRSVLKLEASVNTRLLILALIFTGYWCGRGEDTTLALQLSTRLSLLLISTGKLGIESCTKGKEFAFFSFL